MTLASLLWSYQGRTTRGEFWLGVLVSSLAVVAVFACGAIALVAVGAGASEVTDVMVVAGSILAIGWLVSLSAIHAKRYHDQDRSGWWALLLLVPLGSIWALAECGCRQGKPEPNAFGPVPKGLTRKQRRLLLVGSGMTVLASLVAPVLYVATLSGSIVFFHSPSDVVEKQIKPGVRIRVGGLVTPGSIVRSENLAVRFDVTDGKHTLVVAYQGLLPDLFREGQGVVAEGALESSGTFKADSVLAKHDETYMPKEVADALKKQGHWKDDGAKKASAGAPR